VTEKEGDDWESRLATEETFRPEGGENFFDIEARVTAARDDLLASCHKSGDSVVALVCHNWVIRCLVASAMQVGKPDWYDMKTPTASISCLEYDLDCHGEKPKVVYVGLKPEAPNSGAVSIEGGTG